MIMIIITIIFRVDIAKVRHQVPDAAFSARQRLSRMSPTDEGATQQTSADP